MLEKMVSFGPIQEINAILRFHEPTAWTYGCERYCPGGEEWMSGWFLGVMGGRPFARLVSLGPERGRYEQLTNGWAQLDLAPKVYHRSFAETFQRLHAACRDPKLDYQRSQTLRRWSELWASGQAEKLDWQVVRTAIPNITGMLAVFEGQRILIIQDGTEEARRMTGTFGQAPLPANTLGVVYDAAAKAIEGESFTRFISRRALES